MGILNAIFGPPETIEERNARWASNRPSYPLDGKKVFKCFACGHIHIGSEGEYKYCQECSYSLTEKPEKLEGNGEFVKVLPCSSYGRGNYSVVKHVTYPVFERHENYIVLLRKFLNSENGTYGKYPPMSSKCFMNVNEDGSFFNSCDEELYNLIDKYHIGGRFINRNGVVMDIKGVFHDEDKFMARCKVYHHPMSQVCIGQTVNVDIYELEAYGYKNIEESEYLHGAKDILKKALHGEQ